MSTEHWHLERDRLRRVADLMTSPPPEIGVGFSMLAVLDEMLNLDGTDCGTVACVAGWTLILRATETGRPIPRPDEISSTWIHDAGEWLGLSRENRHALFFMGTPEGDDLVPEMDFADVTVDHAAACVRKLAETGVVDWRGTAP